MAAHAAALALIPARGGSKGIPGKNLQDVGGLPLVVRSIHAAQASHRVTRVVVSTDDDAIATLSRNAGAAVIQRPQTIAGG
jgi:N-acylneuraminate cytidylyltransferase